MTKIWFTGKQTSNMHLVRQKFMERKSEPM